MYILQVKSFLLRASVLYFLINRVTAAIDDCFVLFAYENTLKENVFRVPLSFCCFKSYYVTQNKIP